MILRGGWPNKKKLYLSNRSVFLLCHFPQYGMAFPLSVRPLANDNPAYRHAEGPPPPKSLKTRKSKILNHEK
jgi:hypothetical protein